MRDAVALHLRKDELIDVVAALDGPTGQSLCPVTPAEQPFGQCAGLPRFLRCVERLVRLVELLGSKRLLARRRGFLGLRRQRRDGNQQARKTAQKRKVVEEATGLQEDVWMWDLTSGQKVLVKNASIFLADGKIKIARGTHNGKKLRTMLPGGASLKAKLG